MARTARGESSAFSNDLPPPPELERRSRLIAFVDTLLEPDFALRYFDFDPVWGKNERLASMRSGEGDHYFIWFGPPGALVRGKHQDKKAVPDKRLFPGLPAALVPARDERAFQLGGDSVAAWCPAGAARWASAIDPKKGGAADLFFALHGSPESFAKYAREYHGVRIGVDALGDLFDGAPITAALVEKISSSLDSVHAFAIAEELGLETSGTPPERARKRAAKKPEADDETMGDAEFKIIRLDDTTKLVIGGKVQLDAPSGALYMTILEQVRAVLRAAGAKKR